MAFKSMHVVCPRARRDSAALSALCPSICSFCHLCHGDCSPAVGFQSGLIFNINSLPLLLVLEAFPNSCHLLTAALGAWEGKGREGEKWGSPEEGQGLGSLQGNGAGGGRGGPRVLRRRALCPAPRILVARDQHRRGAVIHGQCLCAGGETWLEQSCRFQRLVSEAQTLEGSVVIAFS